MDRCDRHRTRLDLDPLRGLVCSACDAEVAFFPRDLWVRVVRRVRLWHHAATWKNAKMFLSRSVGIITIN